MEQHVHNMRRKFFSHKKFPKLRLSGALELRGEGGGGPGEGGRGSRGEPPPPAGMKSKASPCPTPPRTHSKSYAKVPNQYGPCAYCRLDKAVASA